MKEYLISVIMAVYNCEPFLEEAVDSLIAQDIGFEENIQLILVNDGATDNSGIICDKYAERYPNIQVFHKPNGGVASARNHGLKYATGKYLNFMDSDDKFSPDALRKMYTFFEEHKHETDIVTIPLQFFDAMTGDHWQNTKFKGGSRVVDLQKEPETSLMFVNATLFSSKLKNEILFDSTLPCGEDIKVIYTLLIHKMTLGVVSDAVYHYRRRSVGEASLIATAHGKKSWYFEYFDNLLHWTIDFYESSLGYIPDYVHYVFALELQWRFMNSKGNDSNQLVERNILSFAEKEQYCTNLKRALHKIKDKYLLAAPFLHLEQKLFVMHYKYNTEPVVIKNLKACDIHFATKTVDTEETLFFTCGAHAIAPVSGIPIHLHFAEINQCHLQLEGEFTTFLPPDIPFQIETDVNGSGFLCDMLPNVEEVRALDTIIAWKRRFIVRIPLEKDCKIQFCSHWDAGTAIHEEIRFGKFCPISHQYASSYSIRHGWMMTHEKDCLTISKAKIGKTIAQEIKFCLEIWDKKELGYQKVIPTRLVAHVLRWLKRKPVWLISDRIAKADDNGEAFFVYMQNHHKHEVRTFFVVDKSSPDYDRMKQIGSTIGFRGLAHKLLVMVSDYIVSSSGDESTFNPFYSRKNFYRDLMVESKFIFLQHGVIKDDLSGWLNRYSKNIYGFITSAKPEWDSIVTNIKYSYPPRNIWLTGLPRFDRLYDKKQKIITVAPTWREYLLSPGPYGWKLRPGYTESGYFCFYKNLLSDRRLLDKAKALGYTIAFMPHPNIQPFLSLYELPEDIKIWGLDKKYREMYAISSMILTDYSSVIFDFAVLRKPILYTHFDYEEFRSKEHVYTEGYFDYERDGFGEVEYDLEGTVNRIIEYMENGCQLKDKYRQRIDNFFAFNDQNNCERVYQKIMELQKS